MVSIHPDHLNTPRLVADATGTTVWRWDQAEPFGTNPADENPSGLGAFDLPLRLPGQYFDKETNLHYNYYRDYDPSIGRYGESDPIGLQGGLNTYSYVDANPLVGIDPEGLATKRYPRVRKCNAEERAKCEKDCYPESVRECQIYETWARVTIRPNRAGTGTVTGWDWVLLEFDCRCGKCDDKEKEDSFLKRLLDYLTSPRPKPADDPFGSGRPKRPPFGQPQGPGGFPQPVPVFP